MWRILLNNEYQQKEVHDKIVPLLDTMLSLHPTDKQKFTITQKIEELVKQILELRKTGKTADAEFLERKIDEMVEVLYGVG